MGPPTVILAGLVNNIDSWRSEYIDGCAPPDIRY